VQDLSPVEHQPVRSVRTQRTIRANPLQPVESTGHGIRPVAHTQRHGLQRSRPVGAKAHGAVRAFAKLSPTHTGPRVVDHRRTRVPGRRFTTTRVQVIFGHERIE